MRFNSITGLQYAVLAGVLAFSTAAFAQHTVGANAKVSMEVGGAPCGPLQSVENVAISAEVINEPAGQSYFTKKHIGQPKYEDITVSFGFGQGRALYDWIAASWKMNYERKDVRLIGAGQARTVSRCLITETSFPPLDAAKKEKGFLKLKFSGESMDWKASSEEPAPPKDAADRLWLISGFRLALKGLKPDGIKRIEAFAVKQTVQSDNLGDAHGQTKEPGKLEFPNLKIAVSKSAAAPWLAWHKDFVVNGNNEQAKERSGALTLIDASGKNVAVIKISNAGIFKITETPMGDGSDDLIVELYVEKMEFAFVP